MLTRIFASRVTNQDLFLSQLIVHVKRVFPVKAWHVLSFRRRGGGLILSVEPPGPVASLADA